MADLLDQVHAETQPLPASGDLLDQVHSQTASGPPNLVDDPKNKYVYSSNGIPVYQNPVAPGKSDDDIIKAFGYDPSVVKASSQYQQNLKQHGSGLSFLLSDPTHHQLANKMGWLQDLGQGAYDVLSGTGQLIGHTLAKLGIISKPDLAYADLAQKIQQSDYLNNIRGGHANPWLRTAGNIITGSALPVPEAAPGAGMGTRVALGAAAGAEQAATQPVDVPPSGDYFGNKTVQVGTGAGVGAAIPAVIGGGQKAVNAIRGRGLPPDAGAVIVAGNQHGVPVSYGDVSGNVPVQKAEVAMEQIPVVGTAGFRQGQQTAAKTAAGNVKQGLYDQFTQTAPEAFEDITKAAASGDQRARNLVDKLQNAGNDPDKVLQASIGLADFRTRQTATDLYDKVEGLIKQNNLGDVPLTGTQNALKSTLAELKAAKLPNRDVQTLLEQVQGGISPKTAPAATNPFPPDTMAWRQFQQSNQKQLPAGNDYGAMRQLLSDLGDRIRTYYEGSNGIIGEKGVGYLERVKNAIEDDLSTFARKSGIPEVQQAGEAADQYYKTARVPFKDGMLAQAATTNEPDQIFDQFIKAGKGDRAQKFYDALDAKGKSAVKYQMVADAVNGATDPARGTFSPQKFFTSMDKLNDAYGVFFKGADKWELDGFKNLMAHITRAGQFAENPPTGNRVIPFLVGGAASAAAFTNHLPAAAGVAGTVAFTKALLTTAAGRNFLLASSKLKPGSAMMESLLERIGARLATKPSNRPQQ